MLVPSPATARAAHSSRKSRTRRTRNISHPRSLIFSQNRNADRLFCQDMGVDHAELGRRLRSRRAALGRTVASVATDAALSVPYVANLENGRGNPTLAALDRLAEALGTRLVLTFADLGTAAGADAGTDSGTGEAVPAAPPSLVEFARTRRFRSAAGSLAALLGEEDRVVRAKLVAALTAVAGPLDRDLHEGDWQRLLDAIVLILGHPSS
ncbi:XRE family transcriptional regulator [Nonomuraea deserti]|uniref:XRE family transcriptional regulator n=1 Tax=Nonomuraea deserti TaxID=1848322 RepID=A0A4V6PCA2_9ACTN|nr:XRE family transcriptional regulator [Nonomuraea deserti]